MTHADKADMSLPWDKNTEHFRGRSGDNRRTISRNQTPSVRSIAIREFRLHESSDGLVYTDFRTSIPNVSPIATFSALR